MLAGFPFAFSAYAANDPAPPAVNPLAEARAALLDAHLAGLKAGLKLTADQEKNWPAFETAIRDAAKARKEYWRQMRDHMGGGERPSPIEHMNMMSQHLQEMSAELKMVADAGKTLYDSLDDSQKRHFGLLLREFLPRGPHDGERMRDEGEGDEDAPMHMQ